MTDAHPLIRHHNSEPFNWIALGLADVSCTRSVSGGTVFLDDASAILCLGTSERFQTAAAPEFASKNPPRLAETAIASLALRLTFWR